MMYLLGNLVGRALVSYVLVWVVWWLVSRFDVRRAFARSLRWYSWLAVLVLSLLGMAAGVQSAGGL